MDKRLLSMILALFLILSAAVNAVAVSSGEGVEPEIPVEEDTLPLSDADAGEEPDTVPDTAVTAVITQGLNPPELTAKAAIVVELNSGVVIYDKSADEARPMASLTKIMTALLILEHGDLDVEVTASESAMEGLAADGSTQNIVPGETMLMRDLLYCIMVASANEACNIAAEEIAGTVPAFVEMMNQRAKELGCENTNFTNTHGLHDDDHYSSAYDMFLITQEAMKHPEFMEVANTTSKSIPPTNVSGERSFFTTNHLISKRVRDGYIYHLAQGIKTGHHSQAGYCLTSSAESDGLHIVTVVMGAERTDDTFMSFVETKALMEWSFETYQFKRILNTAAGPVATVPVKMGEDRNDVTVVPSKTMSALVPKVLDVGDITQMVTIFNKDNVIAPVTRGQELGELTLSYRDYVFGTVPLVADIAVKRSETEHITNEVKSFLEEPWLWNVIYGVIAFIVLYVIVVIIYNAHRRRNRVPGNYRGRKKRRR